ncbi:MAG: heme ABC exporter ATP-binding protein CcmA [Firmicutes bacterium]|nr:heme ABC exporter ATP-binding protein CcmA [Bacillota bacterium]
MVKDVLELRGLQKKIGLKQILKDVSFQSSTGDLVAITGVNGAGKTTLFRILAGLMPKSGGQALWNGENLELNHCRVGFIAHRPMLYGSLSVQENLAFFGQLYETGSPERVQELLELVGLWLYRLEPASVLSRGMQQRLALARALVGNPSLILYDEPFTSLDLGGRDILRQVFAEYRPRTIQLVISHELEHFQDLAYKEIRLEEGRAVQGGNGRG